MPTDAYLDGWFTHKSAGVPQPDNPFNLDTQPYSNRQWINGWCDRHAAVKHGGDLKHDDIDLY